MTSLVAYGHFLTPPTVDGKRSISSELSLPGSGLWNLELPLSALLGVWSPPLVSKEVQHSVPLVPHLFHVKQLSLCTSQPTQSLLGVNPT